jgi:hypothetical protein
MTATPAGTAPLDKAYMVSIDSSGAST